MDGDFVGREEYKEYARRIDEENHRQNKRLDLLEESVKETQKLSVSMEKMATSMESMVKEQEKQGMRLAVLEGRDGDKWRSVVSHALLAVVGAVICYVMTRVGL